MFTISQRGLVVWSGVPTPSASGDIGIEIYRADGTLIHKDSMEIQKADPRSYTFDNGVTGNFYIKITGDSAYYVEAVDVK